MGNAVELAKEQLIRMNNHLSEGTENTIPEFLAQPEEIEASLKIMKILAAN